ncbi:MAG: SRPBCC family protein [Flavobacteriales bacterium]|jgi:uncharacterized protein YndB with AHSA1/START domain|nr:SRPBCC family protein [Flavobacteriales bacterium]
MKFLKAFLVVLLLIVSVLLLIGVFVPAVDDQFETRIDRPVIQVYAAMANLQRAPEWVVGLDSVVQTGGFLAMPGSTFKLYYSGTETNTVYDMEVLEMVPLESVKFKLTNDDFEFDVTVNYERDGLSTNLDVYVQMKGKDLLSRSFLPLMKSAIMDVCKENFEALKELQEQ